MSVSRKVEREILRRKKEIKEKSNTDNNNTDNNNQEDYNNDQEDLYARKKEKTI